MTVSRGDGERGVWDEGLQPERTALAWHRLALTLLGLALAVPKLARPVLGAWALVPAVLVAAAALVMLVRSHRRYGRLRRGLKADDARLPHDGRLPLLVSGIAVVLAGLGGAVVLAHR